jgi:hypothetical protein
MVLMDLVGLIKFGFASIIIFGRFFLKSYASLNSILVVSL